MQLVEQRKLRLDDGDLSNQYARSRRASRSSSALTTIEARNLQDYAEDVVDPHRYDDLEKVPSTALLTRVQAVPLSHTLVHMIHQLSIKYSFLDHILRRWGQSIGFDELSRLAKDIQRLPLVVEPRTKRQHIRGWNMAEYSQLEYMFPTSQMKSRLAHIHRKANGKIRGRDHILRRPLIYEEDQNKDVYHSAGAGGFARPLEHCRRLSQELAGCRADLTTEIIATLLDGGHRRPRAIK